MRCTDGSTVPGSTLVEAACRSAVENQTGDRFERILTYRYNQIRTELMERPDGSELVAEFDALGPVPV